MKPIFSYHIGQTLKIGFAIFAMFFGSGNLVFPLVVGTQSLSGFPWASLGVILAGVFLPFLGVLSVLLFKGDFFDVFGRRLSIALSFLLLSLLGPFGVVPRCITVSYGSFLNFGIELPIMAFSLCACILIYFLALRRETLMVAIGKYLTPGLLIGIFCIIFAGLYKAQPPMQMTTPSHVSLWTGFKVGYETMDLLAAFFFAKVIYDYLQSQAIPKKEQQFVLGGSLLLALCLFIGVYTSFVYLGAAYAPLLEGAAPQHFLGIIAAHALGPYSKSLLCLAVSLACLTTASVLAFLFAEFIQSQLKLPFRWCFLGTLAISFCFSTLDFQGISRFLAPILEILYPGLIILTGYRLVQSQIRGKGYALV